jgi:GT2 family glycosyltransferase
MSKNHSKIAIIVLQYNNSRDTIRCLESVKELNWQDFGVIIVDNASEIQHLNNIRLFVESQEKTNNKKLELIVNEKNFGYASGNNIGIKIALENGANYILVLNPDTTVRQDILTKMFEIQKLNSKIGIVGTIINEGDGEINCGKINWLKPELSHLRQEVCNILDDGFYIPGAAMLIKRAVFEKIGFFDERYFLYFEDADFCERARRAGFKIALAQERLVYHRPSSSTKLLGPAKLLYYHYRNAHLFNWKNGPWWVKIALPFWSFWIILKQVFKILFRENTEISIAILQGVKDFYKGRFGKI